MCLLPVITISASVLLRHINLPSLLQYISSRICVVGLTDLPGHRLIPIQDRRLLNFHQLRYWYWRFWGFANWIRNAPMYWIDFENWQCMTYLSVRVIQCISYISITYCFTPCISKIMPGKIPQLSATMGIKWETWHGSIKTYPSLLL